MKARKADIENGAGLHRGRFLTFIVLVIGVALVIPGGVQGENREKLSGEKVPGEILWDTWGVPHIFAPDAKRLFYMFGWSQAESHGDLLLRLYGEARGRAAEYWGKGYYPHDVLVHTLDIPGRADRWYKLQDPGFRENLDAFARGINDYAAAHPGEINDAVKVVLPVTGADTLAHAQRVFHLAFVGRELLDGNESFSNPGSNAWAIAPVKSASGHAMLLANPHLPWSGLYQFFEAHLNGPGLNAYGATLVGIPVLTIAFNDHLGWTHTVNYLDGLDLYELKLGKNGYLFDGRVEPFTTREVLIKIRNFNGHLQDKRLTILQTCHGPVITKELKEKKRVAVRLVGLDISPTPLIWEQYWDMMRATDLGEFETAVKKLQQPIFNIVYADDDGHIMYLYAGRVPIRAGGDWNDWQGLIPGETSATLWTTTYEYQHLPRVIDPVTGWVQNANDPPWSCTFPGVIKRGDYPANFSPHRVYLRPQRSIEMLRLDDKISFEEMVQYKHSTYVLLADRILDDLVMAARQQGSVRVKKAANILEAWDRCTESNSKGAVLFYYWVIEMGVDMFSHPWDESQPFSTPGNLKDWRQGVTVLEKVAMEVEKKYGSLDVAWGEVNRLGNGALSFPGNGGPALLGIFRVIEYGPSGSNRFQAVSGDSFVAVVEFSTPVKAQVLVGYGNASQPHSRHRGDQLKWVGQKKLRPAWRMYNEIKQHLEKREVF